MSDADQWRARLATSVISLTPRWPVYLAGNGRPTTKTDKVGSQLEATCVVLDAGDGLHALVGLDLLYAGSGLTRAIKSLLPGGLFTSVALYASHTHQAPATDESKPLLGPVDQDYVIQTAEMISGALVRNAQTRHGQEVLMTAGAGAITGSLNRRRRRAISVRWGAQGRRLAFNGAVGAPNPRGSRDDLVSVLILKSPTTGSAEAILWNYACHPVGYPAPDEISAHFIGAVREKLRKHFKNPSLPVLFLQGFSGDLRPDSPSTNRPSQSWPRRLLLGPGYSAFTDADYEAWTSHVARQVVEVTEKADSAIAGKGIRVKEAQLPRDRFVIGSLSDEPVTFRSTTFGRGARVVGVSAELVHYYSTQVRSSYTEPWILPTGCMDDVVGYVPTEAMLREGGYESGGFCRTFSSVGVPNGVQTATLTGFRQVADDLHSDRAMS